MEAVGEYPIEGASWVDPLLSQEMSSIGDPLQMDCGEEMQAASSSQLVLGKRKKPRSSKEQDTSTEDYDLTPRII